jgi:hypothetical protein
MSATPIFFGGGFDDFYSKKLGVRRAHVEAALRSAEKRDDISYMGGNFRLHAARVTKTMPERVLLVLEQVEVTTRTVMQALPVFPDLHPELFSLSPLSIVEVLAEKFGMEFTFAGQTTRFLRDASGPVPPDGRVVTGDHGDRNFALMGLMKFEAGPPKMAHLAMFWMLDTDKFRAWCRDHR